MMSSRTSFLRRSFSLTTTIPSFDKSSSLLTLARSSGQLLSTSTTVLPSPFAHDVYIYYHSSLLDTIILILPGCPCSMFSTTISPTLPHQAKTLVSPHQHPATLAQHRTSHRSTYLSSNTP